MNNTLVAYGCTPNIERDKDLYAGNHAIWATRPLTKRLIDYATGDVKSLLGLRLAQVDKASKQGPLTEARCVAASTKDAEFYKKIMTETRITNIGHFIGPKGSNLHRLQAQVPGSHFKIRDKRANTHNNLLVYADNEEQLAKAKKCTSSY